MKPQISMTLVSSEEERKLEECLRRGMKGHVSKEDVARYKNVLGQARLDVMLFEGLLAGDLELAVIDNKGLGFALSNQAKNKLYLNPILRSLLVDAPVWADVFLE